MTKQNSVEFFTLDQLTLSDINPRQVSSEEYINQMADSLREIGLIQPLAGLRTKTGAEIVAGGSRLRGLQIAVTDRPDLALVPVKIAPDAETAELWAAAENIVRRDLMPSAIIKSARRMRAKGSDVDAISRMFAVTNASSRRYIALSDLSDKVLTALDESKISFDQAKALTLGKGQAVQDEFLDTVIKQDIAAYEIKRHFAGDIRSSDYRVGFVGADDLEAKGAEIVRDLFNDEFSVTGADIVDQAFEEKMATTLDEYRAQGWAWAKFDTEESTYDALRGTIGVNLSYDVLPKDELAELQEIEDTQYWNRSEAQKDRHTALTKKAELLGYTDEIKAVSGVILHPQYNGDIKIEMGRILPEDAEKAREIGAITDHQLAQITPEQTAKGPDGSGAVDAPPVLEMSMALKEDIKQSRLLALQGKMIDNPDLALTILAFQLSGGMGRYSRIMAATFDDNAKMPTKESGLSLNPRLVDRAPYDFGDEEGFETLLASFMEKTDSAARDQIIANALSRSLTYIAGSDFAVIEDAASAHMRQAWVPTVDNFLGRVTVAYLEDLFASLIDAKKNDKRVSEFKKLGKAKDKAAQLERIFAGTDLDETLKITAEQRVAIDLWTPDV